MESHVIEVSGTLAGHMLVGLMLTIWALVWLVEEVVKPREPGPAPLERGRLLPALKLTLPLVAVWFELPNRGWYPADFVQGWQHITMYLGFAATGLLDLLARSGRLSWKATYVGYAGAHLNAALLFLAHGAHGGVPGIAHKLLSVLLAATAAIALTEVTRPNTGVRWLRIGAHLSVGLWLVVVAWILYLSGWEMADPLRVSWTYLLLSGVGMTTAAAIVAARLLTGPGDDASEVVTA